MYEYTEDDNSKALEKEERWRRRFEEWVDMRTEYYEELNGKAEVKTYHGIYTEDEYEKLKKEVT